MTLQANQKLIGQGASFADFATASGVTFAAGSLSAPSVNGTDPVIVNSVASGHGITLASGNTIRGITVGNTPNGFGYNGGTVGTFLIEDCSKTGTGGAIQISTSGTAGTATLNNFNTLDSSSAPAEAINLVNVGGSLVIGAGTITGPAGTAIKLNSGSGNLTYPGNITKNSAGRLLDISSKSGGTVALSGTLSHTHASGTGINVANNTGTTTINLTGNSKVLNTSANTAVTMSGNSATTTLDFTGSSGTSGVNIDTTTVAAVSITGPGVFTIAGSGNTIDSTSGTAFFNSGTGGSATITCNAPITSTTGRLLEIYSRAQANNLTLSGNLNNGGTGILITNNTAGILTFGTTVLNTGTSTALTINTNAGATINFSNGGLKVGATTATALSIIGGGTINVTGGGNQVTNTTGIAFFNSGTGGSATINMDAMITNSTGRLLNIQNRTANTVSLSGGMTNSGTGISLTANTGSTINFTGTIKLNTGANNAFTATGGGTVTSTDTSSTLTTTTGTALNVANTTIGGSGLTFQSISANGAANGIVLNNTGSSGGLTVTGTGTSGSGGTIQNTSGADAATIIPASTENAGAGVFLYNTANISLSWMQIHDNSNYAIYGNTVTGFTLAHSVISGANGNNDTKDEGSIAFDNLLGTASINTSSVSGGWEDNLRLRNTTGTLNRLTIDTVTWGSNSASFGNSALNMSVAPASGSATMNVTVNNCTFTGSRSTFVQYLLNGSATPTGDFVFTGNTITQSMAAISGAGGVFVSGSANATPSFTFNIQNNIIHSGTQPIVGSDINVSHLFGGTYNGTIDNNTIGTAGVANSGSTQGNGISIIQVGGGTYTVHVTNNKVRRYSNEGIYVQVGDNTTGGNGTVNLTITGNTVAEPEGFALHGVDLNIGTTANDAMFVCATIGGAGALKNTLTGAGLVANGGFDLQTRQRFHTTIRLPGYGGANNSNSSVTTFLSGQNTLSTITASQAVASGGGGYVGGAACP